MADKSINLMDFHKIGKKGEPYEIIDNKIADYIIENENIIVIAGIPYIYKGGVYKSDKEGKIIRYLIKSMIIEDLINISRINRVYQLIIVNTKLEVQIENVNQYPDSWINFKNGMLDAKTGELHEHSPKYYSVNQIPHNYIPDQNIEETTFFQFLQSRIPNKDNQRMLFEFMGYAMTKGIIFQKFMILHGLGESGKSTIINFLSAMVGEENISSVPLQKLNERFTTASLLLKTLNTCGDMPASALTDTSVIKQLTGEDNIKGEYKGKDVFFFRNKAKMIFSCNELPRVLDEKSNGFYRRLLLIGFSESGEYIPDLKRKLADESEMEKVISGVVFYFKKSLISGVLFESSENSEAIQRMKIESDSVEAFLTDMTEESPNHFIKKADVYSYYEQYCKEETRQPQGKQAFYKSMGIKGYATKMSNGYEGYRGLDINLKPSGRTVFDNQ